MRGSESSVITSVMYKDHQYRSNYLILNLFFKPFFNERIQYIQNDSVFVFLFYCFVKSAQ